MGKNTSWQDITGAKGRRIRGSSARHVCSIFFETKKVNLTPFDLKVINALAVNYAYTARKKNGFEAYVIGFADQQPSQDPNNDELAADRAKYVARAFRKGLARESKIIQGRFDIEESSYGDNSHAESEYNLYRRVDIRVVTPHMVEPPPPPPGPDLSKYHALGKFRSAIQNGTRETLML